MLRKLLLLQLAFVFSLSAYSQQRDSLAPLPQNAFRSRQLYAPAALLLSGVVTNTMFKDQIKYKIVEERNKHLPGFYTPVDNYLQYAPIPIAYGLDLLGVPSRNDAWNRSVILVKGEIAMIASVNILKVLTKQRRPDGSSLSSFPSGHTAQAFAAATFLSEEYKDRLPWMPYAAYTLASATGILRMANNRHYIGDVLFGAGLGILSMKMAYWTHQYRWNRKKRQPRGRF